LQVPRRGRQALQHRFRGLLRVAHHVGNDADLAVYADFRGHGVASLRIRPRYPKRHDISNV